MVICPEANTMIFLCWCPREESNFDYKIRNLASYPLNDEGKRNRMSF